MRAWQWLRLQSYRQVWTGTFTCRVKVLREICSEWIVASNEIYICVCVCVCVCLSRRMTSPATPHSNQGFLAGERTASFTFPARTSVGWPKCVKVSEARRYLANIVSELRSRRSSCSWTVSSIACSVWVAKPSPHPLSITALLQHFKTRNFYGVILKTLK
jgi:hypothetical protein